MGSDVFNEKYRFYRCVEGETTEVKLEQVEQWPFEFLEMIRNSVVDAFLKLGQVQCREILVVFHIAENRYEIKIGKHESVWCGADLSILSPTGKQCNKFARDEHGTYCQFSTDNVDGSDAGCEDFCGNRRIYLEDIGDGMLVPAGD